MPIARNRDRLSSVTIPSKSASVRAEGIVPPWQGLLGLELQGSHLLIGNLDLDLQLGSEVNGLRFHHRRFEGVQKRAVDREMNGLVRPKPVGVELGEWVKGVVAPPMGVARSLGDFLEFAENSDVDCGPQGRLEF